ncbi:MAG: hypothetical protein HP059_13635, partial [Clostridium sp.]|nr:hypothetical protein [Clostridium sp.]
MALGVISPECEDRAGSLLDVLALSQALLCTQASFGAGGEEEITALAPAHREYCPCLPYSRVKPLEEALTCPGGGRYALIMEAINERPEDLKDYRLSAAMVTALSDSYRDIAVTAARYLAKQDKGLLPLIKEGFENLEVFINTQSEASPEFAAELRKRADRAGARIRSLHSYLSGTEPYLLFSAYHRRF